MTYERIMMTFAVSLFFAGICLADDSTAIAALEKSGAIVKRDANRKGNPVVLVTCNLLQVTAETNAAFQEIEFLPAVEFLGGGNTEITAATLKALQDKKSLKQFSISFAKITDNCATLLSTLQSLESLNLGAQADLSPAGLKQLLNLPNLKELTLSDRLVNDQVLAELSKLTSLETLNVRSVFVTDAGIQSLKRIKNLQTLRLFVGSQVSDDGLMKLADLNLKEFDLTFSNVTNEKLRGLRKFSNLKSLKLINAAQVTDDGIPFLSELTDLKELDLADATLTKSGIQKLKKALPKCTVVYENRKRD